MAAIYDSYPLYSYRISVLHPTTQSFEHKMAGMNASILPIVKTTDQATGQNHDRLVALNVQHAQQFFEPDITAKAANLRSGYDEKICDNAVQLHILEGKMQKLEQQIKGELAPPKWATMKFMEFEYEGLATHSPLHMQAQDKLHEALRPVKTQFEQGHMTAMREAYTCLKDNLLQDSERALRSIQELAFKMTEKSNIVVLQAEDAALDAVIQDLGNRGASWSRLISESVQREMHKRTASEQLAGNGGSRSNAARHRQDTAHTPQKGNRAKRSKPNEAVGVGRSTWSNLYNHDRSRRAGCSQGWPPR